MDTKFQGQDEILYVSATDPGTTTESRDPDNYTRVGLILNKQWSSARTMVSTRDHDSGQGADDVPTDDANETLNVTFHRAKDGNTGQNLLYDAYTNKTLVYWIITTNTVGDYARTGTAYIDSADEASDTDAQATGSANFKVQSLSERFEINT